MDRDGARTIVNLLIPGPPPPIVSEADPWPPGEEAPLSIDGEWLTMLALLPGESRLALVSDWDGPEPLTCRCWAASAGEVSGWLVGGIGDRDRWWGDEYEPWLEGEHSKEGQCRRAK